MLTRVCSPLQVSSEGLADETGVVGTVLILHVTLAVNATAVGLREDTQ